MDDRSRNAAAEPGPAGPNSGPGPIGPELLGELFDRHGAALALYARQLCDSPDDVVQQAFIQLADQKKLPEAAGPWLFRVTRNAALTAARAAKRRARHEQAAAAATAAWFAPREAIDPEADEAVAALAELPQMEREVIVAHLWGGLTFEQIGHVQQMSSSSAHRAYHAGLALLQARLASKPSGGTDPSAAKETTR